jgi:hypothetical protein
MRTFYIHPLVAAIIFTVLVMGTLGGVVALPIVCISWVWNMLVVNWTALPTIDLWQSTLLYLAVVCVIYLSGLVRIEFKAETVD